MEYGGILVPEKGYGPLVHILVTEKKSTEGFIFMQLLNGQIKSIPIVGLVSIRNQLVM